MAATKRAPRTPLTVSDIDVPEGAAALLGAHKDESVRAILQRLCAQSKYPEPYLKLRKLAQLLNIPGRSRLHTKRQLCAGIARHLQDKHGEDVDPEEVANLVHADTQYIPQRALALVGEFAGSPMAVDVIRMGQLGRERYFGEDGRERKAAQRLRQRVRDTVLREKARRIGQIKDDKLQFRSLIKLHETYGRDMLVALADVVNARELPITLGVYWFSLLNFPNNPLIFAVVVTMLRGGKKSRRWIMNRADELIREGGHLEALRYILDQASQQYAIDVFLDHNNSSVAKNVEAVGLFIPRVSEGPAKAAARAALALEDWPVIEALSRVWPGDDGVEGYVQRLRDHARLNPGPNPHKPYSHYGRVYDRHKSPFPHEEIDRRLLRPAFYKYGGDRHGDDSGDDTDTEAGRAEQGAGAGAGAGGGDQMADAWRR